MAHEVGTRPLPPTPVQTEVAAGPSFMDRVDRVLEGLWHFLSSMRFALVLILALAALGVVGALVIQASPGIVADPQAKADWLNEIRPRFGGWTDIMDTLGLFNIFNSLIFRVLMAALTISLIACSIHRFPGMLEDRDEAPRGRRRLVLRARTAARGHRRPPHAGRDPRAPRGRPQGASATGR